MPKLLTVEELAAVIQAHPNTILAGVRSGRIPAFKIGPRVLRFDLETVLKAMATKPTTPTPSAGDSAAA